MKKTRRLKHSHCPKTKLLYNHYVGPGDGWTFLGSSDPSDDSLDVPLPSPSSVAINQLQVPPSHDVMTTRNPFDFLCSDVSITGDDCSFSCVYSIDDDSSSVSTVQHANTELGRVNQYLSPDKTAGREQSSPSTPFSGVGRVNASFDLSLHLKLSQASHPLSTLTYVLL